MSSAGQHLAFPFRIGNDGRTVTADTVAAQVLQELEQLVLTNPGERLFLPDFGGGATRLLFEAADANIASVTQATLTSAIRTWLAGRVDLQNVTVTTSGSALNITIVYQVAGGKPVYAYRLGTALLTQSIYPGVNACIEGGFGTGKTALLAKGLVLEIAGNDAAAEGMGFGVPIVHYPDGWVYSRTATTDDLSTPTSTIWRRTYELNEIGGDAAHAYAFVPIASRGVVEVTYAVDTSGITVTVHVVRLTPGYTEVGILNEQSAAFNDFAADKGQTLIGATFGSWVPVDGVWARLQSKRLGVQFSLPSITGAQLHGGRELAPPDFDWAGLDYIFGPSFTDTSYVIKVQEAR